MDTITIQLTNSKAYKLIEDMEELNLIKVIKKQSKMSDLRGRISSPMTNDEINNQLKALREEWQRNS